MKKIKMIRVNAKLNVHGIFNFNGSDTSKGQAPHKHAKKFTLIKGDGENARKEVRDYTSSNCLRHLIFLEDMEVQPTDTLRANMLEKVAGSVGGILRGYMALKVSNTIRRTSPLFVSDAMSDEAVLQKDFNLTSKNTEEEDGATSKIFTSDTAPYRKQSYSIGLNIKNLRFLRQDRVWTNSVSPDDKSEKLWVEELRNTFKKLGCSDDVEIKNNYIDSNDICHSATRGIHLSNEQTRAVVKATLVKSLSVNAMKAKASIETDPSSIEALVTFEDGSTRKYSSLDELLSDIDKAEFQDFYYEGAEGMTLPERDELRAKLEGRAQAKKEQKSKEKEEKKAAKQQKAA